MIELSDVLNGTKSYITRYYGNCKEKTYNPYRQLIWAGDTENYIYRTVFTTNHLLVDPIEEDTITITGCTVGHFARPNVNIINPPVFLEEAVEEEDNEPYVEEADGNIVWRNV